MLSAPQIVYDAARVRLVQIALEFYGSILRYTSKAHNNSFAIFI